MSETKTITTMYVVTDSENYYDKIGDIDGGLFDDEWLMEYIQYHGTDRLLKKLASMQTQVIMAERKIIQMEQKNDVINTNINPMNIEIINNLRYDDLDDTV